MTNEEYERIVKQDKTDKREEFENKYPFLVLKNIQKPENGYRVDVSKLAIFIKSKYDIKYYKGQFRILNNHYYGLVDDIKVLIQKEVPDEYIQPRNIEDAEKILERDYKLILHDEDIASKKYICFVNGILDTEGKKLYDFDDSKVKDLIFINQVGFPYDPDAERNEVTDNFFKSITNNNREDIDFLLQILGVMISGYRDFKNIFYFVGAKDTGKSVFMKVSQNLLTNPDGTEDYSNIGLRTFTDENSFELVTLVGKRANICGETPPLNVSNDVLLKQLSGGDNVDIKVKFKESVSFRNTAMLLFAGNKIPNFFVSEKASISERMLIYRFKNVIPKDKQVKGLEDKIDMKYLIKLAIEQLYIFIENNQEFTVPSEIYQNQEDLLLKSDTIYKFFKEKIIIVDDEDERVSVKDLYKEYLYFLVDEGHLQMGYNGEPDTRNNKITQYKFTGEMKEHIGEQNYKRNLAYRGKQATVFVNIKISESSITYLDENKEEDRKVINMYRQNYN